MYRLYNSFDWILEYMNSTGRLYTETICHVFHAQKMVQSCLPASIVLCEMLRARGVQAELCVGYAIETDRIKMGYRHVWVQVDDEVFDPGLRITQMNYPDYPTWYRLSATLPTDVTIRRLDMESPAAARAAGDLELALRDIKKKGTKVYWNKYASIKLKRIRKELSKRLEARIIDGSSSRVDISVAPNL